MKNRVCIIAEIGVNHNGSVEMAKQMIKIAAEAQVDVVKFQTAIPENVISKFAVKAEYQNKTTDSNESQLDMVKKITLPFETYTEIMQCCRENHIEFLSTPFDLESVDFLVNKCGINRIKIPSGEITNAPLLLKAAQSGKPIILSTGMSMIGEIELALSVLAYGYLKNQDIPKSMDDFFKVFNSQEGQDILNEKVSLLHCTTEYPAPFESVNLKAMDTLKNTFDLAVGYSDHTQGIAISLAAVARGANIIEKHFTLDRNLPGPDHKASLEPNELKEMVKEIRNIEMALGCGRKLVATSEEKNKNIARKSLIAKSKILKGEVFSKENLTIKRPGYGISPMEYWRYLGKVSEKDYEEDEVIK